MMLTISWILTLVIVLTLPLSIVIVARIAKRSQKFFMQQQAALGALNGHVSEMYGGHTIVTAFGHEKKSVGHLRRAQRQVLRGRVARTVRHRHHHADHDVRRQHRVRPGGGDRRGCSSRGARSRLATWQAFIQYGRQFSMPITQLSGIANMIQLTIVAAERVFELLDEPEETPDAANATSIASPRGAVQFDAVSFRYKQDVPLIEELSLDVTPGQ
jgi:ATP-binding cassette subfamily B protein